MVKSSRNNSDSDSDVSDDLSFNSLSSKVVELENALCNQDKLLCKKICENKKFNLELENSFIEIASLRSMHDAMSAKPCENSNIIMMNYDDLWIVHTQVSSQLKGAKLELKELKARSSLLGACTSCPMLKSNLEACSIEIKELKHKIDHSSRHRVFSPPCEMCGSFKGKFFHATKENTELKQEVAYLTSHLERTVVREKMIEDNLNRVKENATKSTYNLGVSFERCEDKGEEVLPSLFLALTTTKRRKHSNPPKLTTHPIQSHLSTPRER
jgi:hypothetical protein